MSIVRYGLPTLLLSPLLFFAAGPAMASPERVVVVGAPGLSAPPATDSRELVPMSMDELQRLVRQSRQQQILAGARRRAREGQVLIGHLRRKEATKALLSALAAFAKVQELPQSCHAAREAMQDLAYIWWQRKRFARAHWWAAGAGLKTLNAERHTPEFLRFVRKALRTEITPRTVAVITRPAGAQVFIDCRPRGLSPLSIELKGAALIGARSPGLGAAGQVATSAERPLQPIALPRQQTPALERLAASLLDGLLRAQHASALWVWRTGARGRELWRYRSGRGWRRWQAPEGSPSSDATTTPPPPQRSRFGLGKWLLASGAATALIVGSVFGVVARTAADDLEKAAAEERLFDQALYDAQQRRDTFGPAAYALWGVGIAAAAALVTWVLLDWPSSQEEQDDPRASLSAGRVPSLKLRF